MGEKMVEAVEEVEKEEVSLELKDYEQLEQKWKKQKPKQGELNLNEN